MHDDTVEPFVFPVIGRKKLIAAFDGGRLTSNGGVMLLAAAERSMGIAQRLATLIVTSVGSLVRATMPLRGQSCGPARLNAAFCVVVTGPPSGLLSQLCSVYVLIIPDGESHGAAPFPHWH